ncbi:hypothetical protein M513_09968 [Trichuris suis]|nr:hypothetical protein M513_09968 [Trichuris suis]
MRFIVSAIDEEGNSGAPLLQIWKSYYIRLTVTSIGDAVDGLTVPMRNGVWKKLCPEAKVRTIEHKCGDSGIGKEGRIHGI